PVSARPPPGASRPAHYLVRHRVQGISHMRASECRLRWGLTWPAHLVVVRTLSFQTYRCLLVGLKIGGIHPSSPDNRHPITVLRIWVNVSSINDTKMN